MDILLILSALVVAFANGANDISKGIATLVGSGVSNYRAAVIWGTVWTVLGAVAAAFVTQTLVATFSGKGLLQNPATSQAFLLAVSIGAIGWLAIATRTGMPVSTTHSLVGALVGAALVEAGADGILWAAVLSRVAYPLLFSPFVSLVVVLLLLPLLRPLARRVERYCVCLENTSLVAVTPEGAMLRQAVIPIVEVAPQASCREAVARVAALDGLHWLSAGATSFFRGLNDTPKILALGIAGWLAVGSSVTAFYVIVAAAMAAGSLTAGRRVTDTLAKKVVRLSPTNGFSANLTTSILVGLASRFALPVSTTHVSSGAIIGIGVADSGDVRWRAVIEMVLAWVVTLPVSGLIAGAVYLLIA